MSDRPGTLPTSLHAYERFHRWRHRQRARWPGLFASSFCIAAPPASPAPTVVLHRDGTAQLSLTDAPVVICDGCALLQPVPSTSSSSASTLPPRAALSSAPILRCVTCGFATPLGALRRLLGLSSAGPALPTSLILALFVEAVGVPHASASAPSDRRSWFADADARRAALTELLTAIGVADECVLATPSSVDTHWAAANAQRVLCSSVQPPLRFRPTRRTQVQTDLLSSAISRADCVLEDVVSVWRGDMVSDDHARVVDALSRLHQLSASFVSARRDARIINHAIGTIPNVQLRVSQPSPPLPVLSNAPHSRAPTADAPPFRAPTSDAPPSRAPTSVAPPSRAPTSDAPASDAPRTTVPPADAPPSDALPPLAPPIDAMTSR